MRKKLLPVASFIVILMLFQAACQISLPGPETPTPILEASATLAPTSTIARPEATKTRLPTPIPASPTSTPTEAAAPTPIVIPASGEQPASIVGNFTYTNSTAVETYYVEQAVALADMHGFVGRDKEWKTPIESQVLGFLSIDKKNKTGSYHLELPAIPEGTYNNVSHSAQKTVGVQIFAVSYWPNLAGGPFAEGDDPSTGWPNYLASVLTDSGNKNEVTGGKLIVWAPDDRQLFPTGFGPDGLLFTADDPVGPLPAGYSVIDLDQKPFNISRHTEETLTLYEPKDYAIKDFSGLSYVDGFKQAFDIIRQQYAFNGIPGKAPNWDRLYADIAPRIQAAQDKKDVNAYFLALNDFTLAFQDGHVGLNGGQPAQAYLNSRRAFGYGLAARELDDGSVIVAYITSRGPADAAGIKLGAQLISFNGTPVKDAISKVIPLSPNSTDYGKRYEQVQLLLRTGSPDKAEITFQNSGESPKTITFTAVQERSSYIATSLYRNYDPNALPVEFQILPSGAGYIKINSSEDDLNLLIRLFQRALQTFQENQVSGLIIDLRLNLGGAPLGLAGFLYNRNITLGQLSYYSSTTGKFEPDGPVDKFTPNVEQFRFSKMALLVDQSCYSACELEAYGFSQVPGMMVIGYYPTGGTEAEVSRGQFTLSEGITMQIPMGRYTKPDGSLFLEGTGVQPTIKVPINADNVLSTDDVVLSIAEQRVSQ